ncbi:hypothetical protein GIB67_032634, partial [Kingdonia uniflora]
HSFYGFPDIVGLHINKILRCVSLRMQCDTDTRGNDVDLSIFRGMVLSIVTCQCCITMVLPDDMVVLTEPVPSYMVKTIQKAIYILPKIGPEVMRLHVPHMWCLGRKALLPDHDLQFLVMVSTMTMEGERKLAEYCPDVATARVFLGSLKVN